MDDFKLWILEKPVWEKFTKCNLLELERLIKHLESGSVGLGMNSLYRLNYGFTGQVGCSDLVVVQYFYILSIKFDSFFIAYSFWRF